jgi:2-oxoglutarate ferredoxin oxidoreductase subunit gamma
MVLIDQDLVKPKDGDQFHAIPATKLAEDLGRRIVTNVVMLGYVTAQTHIVTPQAMMKALEDTLNSRILELNIKAFNAGLEFHARQNVDEVPERTA